VGKGKVMSPETPKFERKECSIVLQKKGVKEFRKSKTRVEGQKGKDLHQRGKKGAKGPSFWECQDKKGRSNNNKKGGKKI